jgi:hypothetical protein
MNNLINKITTNKGMARIWIQNALFLEPSGFGANEVYYRFTRGDSIILESAERKIREGQRLDKDYRLKHSLNKHKTCVKVSKTTRGGCTIDILAQPMSNFILDNLGCTLEDIESNDIFINCKATTSDNHKALKLQIKEVA